MLYKIAMVTQSCALMSVGIYDWGCEFAFAAVLFLAACVTAQQHHLIVHMQSWLMSRGEAATAAAGVAELLGRGCC